jgi:hypothetical protein
VAYGIFVNPTKDVTHENDVDVVLAFETYEAIDEFIVETYWR